MPKNNIIDCKRAEASPAEPVTLAQAKAQLIVTSTDDDTYITALITQCRKAVENYCFVSMVTKTITLTADLYNEWELPYGPVAAITSVKTREGVTGSGPAEYTTDTQNWQTDGEEFLTFRPSGFDFGNEPPVEFANQWMRPERYRYWYNRYRIVYTAGPYTPQDLVLAVLQEIAFRFENRGDQVEIRPTVSAEQGLCPAAQHLSELHRRLSWL